MTTVTDALLARDDVQAGFANFDTTYTVPAATTIASFNVHASATNGAGTLYVGLYNVSTTVIDSMQMAEGDVYNKTFKMLVPAGYQIVVFGDALVVFNADVHISGEKIT